MTSQTTHPHSKGLPLIYCITALAAAGTIALSLLITSYTYFIFSEQEDFAKNTQFQNITKRLEKEINYKTTPLFALAQNFATTANNIENIATNPRARKEFLYANTPTLLYYPTIFTINYTLKNGFYVYLVNLEHIRSMLARGTLDKTIIDKLQELQVPSHTRFLLIYSSPTNNQDFLTDTAVKIEYYSTNLDLFKVQYLSHYASATERPWFNKTLKNTTNLGLTLTGPYLIPETNKEGITVSCPLNDGYGVYSITTHLDEFMHFITGSIENIDGSIFVLDEKQENILTTHPDPRHREILESCEGIATINNNTIIHTQSDHNALIEKAGYTHAMEHTLHALLKQNDLINNVEGIENKKIVTLNNQEFNFEIGKVKFASDTLNILMLINHQNINSAMRTNYINMIIFTIIIITIMIPIIYFSTRKISVSMKALSKEAARIAQADFSPTLPVESQIKEVKELANSMGLMKTQLKSYTEELKYVKDSLEEQVKEQTKDLQKALEKATNATEAKAMFLSAMSHELRTPMNAILGFTYIFDKNNLSQDQKNQLEKIRFSGESLLHIINDILDFSKLESNKVEIEKIDFSLDQLLSQTMDIMQSLAKKKGIELILEKDKNLPDSLEGDPNRLRQVFINLIGNAIKFTDKGHVKLIVQKNMVNTINGKTIILEKNQTLLSFHVQDTGIGMTEAQMSKLFQVFSQADSSISRKYGGSGLGLTISRQLISLMGGEITVQSMKDVGSQFTSSIIFNVLNTNTALENKTMREEEASKEETIERHYKEGALALVVDDRQINLEVANALFRKYNIKTENAMSGKEAVDMVQNKSYDIIFLDVQMPEMDGLTAARIMRTLKKENPECKTDINTVPIIAMTANAMPEDRQKSLDAGMDEHLPKPITPISLLAMIEDWLAVDGQGNRVYPKRHL